MSRPGLRSVTSAAFGREIPVLTFGTLGLPDLPEDEALALVRAALDLGFEVFDTADGYGGGQAERLLGRALGPREGLISTKVGMSRTGGVAHGRLRAGDVIAGVDRSLERLGRDHVDIVFGHMPDPWCPVEEVVAGFDEVVTSGRARAYGLSNHPADLMVEAVLRSRYAGGVEPTALQAQYSILDRSAEAADLPAARRLKYDVFTWGPLASGWLTPVTAATGRPTVSEKRSKSRPDSFGTSVPENVEKARIVTALAGYASERGLSVSDVAIAFAATHPAVTSVIIGPAAPDQLEDCVRAVQSELAEDLLDRIDDLVAPGSMVNPLDAAWRDLSLLDANERRRA